MQHCTKNHMFLNVPMTSLVSIIIMRSAPPRGTGA